MPVVWSAVVAQDLLVALHSYHLAGERTSGDADALFEKWQQKLEDELLVPRGRSGVRGTMADAREALSRLEGVMGAAAAEFSALPKDGPANDLRDVLLAGDIFLRGNEWGNDDLQRRLAAQGLRVLSEPFGEFFELLAYRQVQELPTAGEEAAGADGHPAAHALHRRPPAWRRPADTAVAVLARHRGAGVGQPGVVRRVPVRRDDHHGGQRAADLAARGRSTAWSPSRLAAAGRG